MAFRYTITVRLISFSHCQFGEWPPFEAVKLPQYSSVCVHKQTVYLQFALKSGLFTKKDVVRQWKLAILEDKGIAKFEQHLLSNSIKKIC